MSSLQEIAAKLMEIGGQVPVEQAEQARIQVQMLHEPQADATAAVLEALGEASALHGRLWQNAQEAQAAIREAGEMAGNAIAMLQAYRASLQEAAAEVINR
ncbi:hypothetical protein F9C11_20295 [Amycolatopsis sp. VS8301801F10]|uniref:hypothetical protein n=1 Tax=unclassified Amycolatopsis TaxID=2618356 RepID=UPI0038FC963E